MDAVFPANYNSKQRNEVMTIVYKLEQAYLNGQVERISSPKVRLSMNVVFGPLNADEGGLRTYALDPSFLSPQLLNSDVPQLGMPKIDYDAEESDHEECVELVQNVRNEYKFIKPGSLDTADIFIRQPDFEAGYSSCPGHTVRNPFTTAINTQQLAPGACVPPVY